MSDHDVLTSIPPELRRRAAELDAQDPLGHLRADFITDPRVVAYLDGNSLGRPLRVSRSRLDSFVEQDWGERLIRSWDEQWMELPTVLGDQIGRVVLGAAPGQTVVADSTTVNFYKLVRAALRARPHRKEIIADTENFPTDRYVLEGIAEECGVSIRWITADAMIGVQLHDVVELASENTALVTLSHVSYKSASIADMEGITSAAHDVGALVLWDLCHSAGALDVELDRMGVDLAVGCTYKYLNGGPGAPAFAYVSQALLETLKQPINGWMGHADPFRMGPQFVEAPSIRRFLSGTPSILAMTPLQDMVALIERAGMPAVRAKSTLLTEFAIELADRVLSPFGVRLGSPRDPALRGSHVMLEHLEMEQVVARLWRLGVIPDFRPPHGLRAGLSPLSTGFEEVAVAIAHLADVLYRYR